MTSTEGHLDSLQAKACSRPPLPMTRMRSLSFIVSTHHNISTCKLLRELLYREMVTRKSYRIFPRHLKMILVERRNIQHREHRIYTNTYLVYLLHILTNMEYNNEKTQAKIERSILKRNFKRPNPTPSTSSAVVNR